MTSDKKKYFRNSNLDQLIKTIVERVTNTNETRLITKERISRTMLTTYHELRDPAGAFVLPELSWFVKKSD